MRRLPRTPPLPQIELSWRSLWRGNAFAQADLTWQTQLGSRAQERGLLLGIGSGPFEGLDQVGAFQPILFAEGGTLPDVTDVAAYESRMTFREEHNFRSWEEYAWDSHGRPHTSAMYSPWQLLYADDVLDSRHQQVGLSLLVGPEAELRTALEQSRPNTAALHEDYRNLDVAWRPLMKLLVRVQNRYLPVVTGRIRLLFHSLTSSRVDPWPDEYERFDPPAVISELGLSVDDIKRSYWFLVERAIDREPEDGLELLRRARPRDAHRSWRGDVRRAQDNYDAAAMLRLLLEDLTGTAPPRVPFWPLDGRQGYRAAIYESGPVPVLPRERLQELIEAGLYPHGVHVVGEGKSEKEMVGALVAGFLGESAADELGFTDLGGSGSASRLPTMIGGFTTYARRTVLIVDTEGAMEEYVHGLELSNALPAEDILRFTLNLEDSNFTPGELVDTLAHLAASGSRGLTQVSLTIAASDLELALKTGRARGHEKPGRAGVLLKLAEDPAFGGPYRISKPDFAAVLAKRMLEEWDMASTAEAREELYRRRPLLEFVLARVLEPLQRGW